MRKRWQWMLWLVMLVVAVGCSKKKKTSDSDKKVETEKKEKTVRVTRKGDRYKRNRPMVRRKPTGPRLGTQPPAPKVNPYRRRYRDTRRRLKGKRGHKRFRPRPKTGPRMIGRKDPRHPRHPGHRKHLRRKSPHLKKTPPPAPLPKVDPLPKGKPLNLRAVISLKELHAIVGKKWRLKLQTLQGQEPGPGYNALYFQPRKSDLYGVGIQIWKLRSKSSARRQYSSMRRSYPNMEKLSDLPGRSFIAYRNQMVYLSVLVPQSRSVIAVSCSRALCPAYDTLLSLAKTVRIRVLANL